MSLGMYFIIGYLIIINIVTFVLYISEAESPSSRISAVALILLPVLGGSLGAVLANYFSDTEYRELRCWLSKFIGYLPPIMLVMHIAVFIYSMGLEQCVSSVWSYAYSTGGIIGCILLIMNALSYVLIVVRKSAYYIAPHGNFLIPDLILIPILVLGGATGGVVAKVMFNFKEDWSCNCTKTFQNFIYNWGMFLISALYIGLYIYFFIAQ